MNVTLLFLPLIMQLNRTRTQVDVILYTIKLNVLLSVEGPQAGSGSTGSITEFSNLRHCILDKNNH